MATQQKVSTKAADWLQFSARLDPSGGRLGPTGAPVRYGDHSTAPDRHSLILGARARPVVTMSQLASQLGVSVQALYDLRSQGRGPLGFRVAHGVR